MNADLLDSQFEILEPPDDAIRVDVTGTLKRSQVRFDSGWGYDEVE